jgi:CRP-like cAMP-binding protein
LFGKTIPLRSLSIAGQKTLAKGCYMKTLYMGETLYGCGDHSAARPATAFILVSGSLDLFDADDQYIMSIERPHLFFGEESVLFDEPRVNSARAGEGGSGSHVGSRSRSHAGSSNSGVPLATTPVTAKAAAAAAGIASCTLCVIRGESILHILESGSEMAFSQTLSERVRSMEGKMSSIYKFDFQLRAALDLGTVDINRLLPEYVDLEPAIHTGVKSKTALDVDAWSYAVNRLPKDINSIFSLVLSERLSESPSEFGESLPTKMRRRTVRMVMPGKAFVLLRPGHSDATDLVTCLCLHVVESRKLRQLMKPVGRTLTLISEALLRVNKNAEAATATADESSEHSEHSRAAVTVEALRRASGDLLQLRDINALMQLYPTDLLEQIR